MPGRGSVFGLKGGVELIEKLRNRATRCNARATMLDGQGKPNNGPFEARRTRITLDAKTRKPVAHFDDFLYGRFMKFTQRGAVRVDSGGSTRRFANVAGRNPDGHLVPGIVNAGGGEKSFNLVGAGRTVATRVNGKSVATFIRSPELITSTLRCS